MNRTSILIADDDSVLRGIYHKKFTAKGYSVRTAKNGEEVLSCLEREKPDLLILDINMPILDGFSVLERLPKNTRHFPIIVLSNFSDEKNKQRSAELGADYFAIKCDMTIRKLLDLVERLLNTTQ